jgi:hypothetical protein
MACRDRGLKCVWATRVIEFFRTLKRYEAATDEQLIP